MIFYVLPGTGMYGGVKKGFHCADLLTGSGYPCAVATPDGGRPNWFESRCATLTHAELAARCVSGDTVLFSCPSDAPVVDALPARRKVVHMQGAITEADFELMAQDRSYEYISHGLHMSYELQLRGRVAPYVPLGVPDVFRHAGETRTTGRVALMPRRGGGVVDGIRSVLRSGEELVLLDGLPEARVAEALKGADVFVAISPVESFGIPPLEAMCAGCCVVGYPGVGGFEFMRHMETAHVVPNGDERELLRAVRQVLDDPAHRDRLRLRGQEVSATYTLARERTYLLRALGFVQEAPAS